MLNKEKPSFQSPLPAFAQPEEKGRRRACAHAPQPVPEGAALLTWRSRLTPTTDQRLALRRLAKAACTLSNALRSRVNAERDANRVASVAPLERAATEVVAGSPPTSDLQQLPGVCVRSLVDQVQLDVETATRAHDKKCERAEFSQKAWAEKGACTDARVRLALPQLSRRAVFHSHTPPSARNRQRRQEAGGPAV